jgi:hypothetical protein
MKWLAKARFFNAAVAVVAVLAWFSGTNHCALGLIKAVSNFSRSNLPLSGAFRKNRRQRPRSVWDVGLLSGTSEFEYRRRQGEDLF